MRASRYMIVTGVILYCVTSTCYALSRDPYKTEQFIKQEMQQRYVQTALQKMQQQVAGRTWTSPHSVTENIASAMSGFDATKNKIISNIEKRAQFEVVDKEIIARIKSEKPQRAQAITQSHIASRFKLYETMYPDDSLPFLLWKHAFLAQCPSKYRGVKEYEKLAARMEDARSILNSLFPAKKEDIGNLSSTTDNQTIEDLLSDINKLKESLRINAIFYLAELIGQSTEDLDVLAKIIADEPNASSIASAYAAAKFALYKELKQEQKNKLDGWAAMFKKKLSKAVQNAFEITVEETKRKQMEK